MEDNINQTNQPGGMTSFLLIGGSILARMITAMANDDIVNILSSVALLLGIVKASVEFFIFIKKSVHKYKVKNKPD